MATCPKCEVIVDAANQHCPLCGLAMEGHGQKTQLNYPDYVMEAKEPSILKKTLFFLTIVICLSTLYINAYTYEYAQNLWSLIVVGSLLYVRYLPKVVFNKNEYFGTKILYVYALTLSYLVVLDIAIGWNGWSLDYVLPIFTMMIALVFGLLVSFGKIKFSEYFGFLLATTAISLLPILCYVIGLSTIMWLSTLSSFVILNIIIGMYIYGKASFKHELKRKLNR